MNSKIKWTELLLYNKKIVFIKFNRTTLIEQKYKNHKLQLLKQNILLKDYLIDTLFNNDLSINYVLTENTFPYNLEENIKHLIFWINPLVVLKNNFNYTFEIIENIITDIIDTDEHLKEYKDFILFKNSDKTKSIKEIEHYHVFILTE